MRAIRDAADPRQVGSRDGAQEPEAWFYLGGAYGARVQWRVLRGEKIAAGQAVDRRANVRVVLVELRESHVETELLCDLDVVLQRLVGGRGVEPVRPEALVERAVLEEELVVQQDACDPVLVLAE